MFLSIYLTVVVAVFDQIGVKVQPLATIRPNKQPHELVVKNREGAKVSEPNFCQFYTRSLLYY